jgi:ParB-like chromosome segregation protein Spo0J
MTAAIVQSEDAPYRTMKTEPVFVDTVRVGKRLRSLNYETVSTLAESMSKIGLLSPIFVHSPDDETCHLVAGHHRLEAARRLGWTFIDAVWVSSDELERSRIEITENLHRADLTVQERAEHIAEWIKLVQLEPVSDAPGGRGRTGGARSAQRELGLGHTEVVRAVQIAGISPEAKQAAKDAGLDNNQRALLEIAKAQADEQVAAVHDAVQRRDRRASPPPTSATLVWEVGKFSNVEMADGGRFTITPIDGNKFNLEYRGAFVESFPTLDLARACAEHFEGRLASADASREPDTSPTGEPDDPHAHPLQEIAKGSGLLPLPLTSPDSVDTPEAAPPWVAPVPDDEDVGDDDESRYNAQATTTFNFHMVRSLVSVTACLGLFQHRGWITQRVVNGAQDLSIEWGRLADLLGRFALAEADAPDPPKRESPGELGGAQPGPIEGTLAGAPLQLTLFPASTQASRPSQGR